MSPRKGLNRGRVDLNDLLTSNEALFSLLVHNTNVVSGPLIESPLIKKKKNEKKKDIFELTIKGYKIGRTAYEIDSSLYNINAV